MLEIISLKKFFSNYYNINEEIMKNIRKTSLLVVFAFSSILLAQSTLIFDGQKKAIRTLSTQSGFTETTLQNYIIYEYGVQLGQLTQTQGSQLIKKFQSGSITPPQTKVVATPPPAVTTSAS